MIASLQERQIIDHVIEYAKRLGVELKTLRFNGKDYVLQDEPKPIKND